MKGAEVYWRIMNKSTARTSFIKLKLTSLLVVGASLTGLAPQAKGTELTDPYDGIRPLGMGGAYTAVANDDMSAFYNPAGIARSRKAWARGTFNLTRFPNLSAGANSAGRVFLQNFKKDVAAEISSKSDLLDNPFWTRAAAFPMTILNLGARPSSPFLVGMVSSTTARALIEKETPDQAQVDAISDLGGVLSYGLSNRNNRISFGLQSRILYRYAYEDVVPTTTLFDRTAMQKKFKDDANKAVGVALDAGAMVTFADFWFPTLGVAVMNLPTSCKPDYLNPYSKKREAVCGTVFKGTFSNPDAVSTVDPTDIRVGLSATPRFSRQLNLRLALDMHHIAVPVGSSNFGLVGVDTGKQIHGGAELFWGNPLLPDPEWAVRLGANQGFITFGASTRLGVLVLDFASYGVDVSSSKSPKEDRRYQGGLSLEF